MRLLPYSLRKSSATVILLAILGVLVALPVALVVIAGFSTEEPRPGNLLHALSRLTLSNFDVFGSSALQQAVWNSVQVGALSASLALVIGVGPAFIAARTDTPFPRLLYAIGIMPLFLPTYIGALAWSVLGAPRVGFLNIVAGAVGVDGFSIYGLAGLTFIFALYNAPYIFAFVHSSLSLMDPDLENAAASHGANLWRVIWWITLPLAAPAALGGAILVFVVSVANFPVSEMIGVPGGVRTLPTVIYGLIISQPSRGTQAAAIGLVLVALLIVATVFQQRALGKRRFTTVAGKGVRPQRIRIGRWRYLGLALALVYLLVSTILPLWALLTIAMRESVFITDVRDLFDMGKLSMGRMLAALALPEVRAGAIHSVIVAIGVAVSGTVLAFAVAYVVHRTSSYGKNLLEFLAMAPLALPTIVLAFGMLWAWLLMPVPIYGTLLVFVVAFLGSLIPYALRSISGAIVQIHPELEESARVHGARRLSGITRVTVPLLRRGLVSTFLLLLMLSMRELTIPIFLFTSETILLSIVVFNTYLSGSIRDAAAVAVWYSLLILFLTAGSIWLGSGGRYRTKQIGVEGKMWV